MVGQIFARGAPAVFDDRCEGRDGASNSLGEERVLHREDEGSCDQLDHSSEERNGPKLSQLTMPNPRKPKWLE